MRASTPPRCTPQIAMSGDNDTAGRETRKAFLSGVFTVCDWWCFFSQAELTHAEEENTNHDDATAMVQNVVGSVVHFAFVCAYVLFVYYSCFVCCCCIFDFFCFAWHMTGEGIRDRPDGCEPRDGFLPRG